MLNCDTLFSILPMFFLITQLLVTTALLQGPAAKLRPLLAASVVAAKPAPVTKPAPAAAISWSATRPLTLADFLGRPAAGEPLAALSATDIRAGAACRDYVFSGTVKATFDPNTSWLRDAKGATPMLLRHEQLHFDLTEVYARLLRQKLVAFQAKANCEKLQPAFDNLTKPLYTAWNREQNRYDQETNHGLNAVRQVYWEKQTQLRLEQLQAFAQ